MPSREEINLIAISVTVMKTVAHFMNNDKLVDGCDYYDAMEESFREHYRWLCSQPSTPDEVRQKMYALKKYTLGRENDD